MKQDQSDIFGNQEEGTTSQGPVECLGMTFPNDQARREYFLEKLREKLKDPEFRRIEGFPIGADEDILALSDPPYYTACPNPFIADFIKHYGKPFDPNIPYSREPFAADVSEGKNDPIYNAHSYHTKVPHKAIMRYILHYTEPGDVVFDGFCGTGMTGVAAQMCGDKATVESLGYRVEQDGTISQQETDENGKAVWKQFSKLGARRAVLNDLSPAATFIAYNYNTPVDVNAFEREAKRILKEVEDECGWMYETLHTDGKTKGKINYTVWSEVYSCPQCSSEVNYFEVAFRDNNDVVEYLEEFECPHCRALCAKSPSKKSGANRLERVWISGIDKYSGSIRRAQKRIPVRINYSIGTKRYEKRIDNRDFNVIEEIETSLPHDNIPTNRMPPGDESRRNDDEGITHTHHFYADRTLSVLSAFIRQARKQPQLEFLLGSVLPKLTIMNRYMPQHGGRALVGPMANTLYVPPVNVENNVIEQLWFQCKKIAQAINELDGSIIATQAAQSITLPNASIDYLFLDPPFGANIMYSELSYIREAWLRVLTNGKPEAVESKSQKKGIDEYRRIMTECFLEAHRVLKPGRWMTVEFSNTKASVWNSIQNALSDVGFIVASVAALDKTRGGLHAMLGPTAVKQDLVISAYKPNGGFEDRFQKEATTEEGVWDFVRTHLKYLPVTKRGASATLLIAVTERDPRILYDQMVAYFVRKGYPVPLNSAAFQKGLSQRFSYRDGMYFLPDQVGEYDKKKLTAGGMEKISLFVSDESSAIAWLRQLLKDKPQTTQDIHPLFIKELGGWQKHEKPLELSELLEQNFLRYDGNGEVPSQIHSYLSTNFKELRNLPKDDENLRAKGKDRWYVPDPN
ncbi:MAG: site-specific DNA-methyltransferase, partial [Proteobacteria bacterium]|nr:site-specific DNA-methyltransferase [Pseudomonadota bacterium]MBU2227182.1 site-specific DNA-methyltransferase [Pseudomonadota bacterium]